MSNTIPVDIEFVLKNMNFQEEAGKMKAGIRGVTTTAQTEANKIQQIYQQMAAGIGVYFSARFLKDFVTQMAQVRGEFQQLEVALETILKSKTEADRLMQQVVTFAATTPFELKDVATGTKQLLAYGFAAEETIATMRMLGDVAAGVSAPIGDIIYLYGTLRTQGRAYTRDILQFTSRGIPIIGELAAQFGVAETEIQKLVEAGKVGFKDIETAFQSLTSETGIFNDLIAKQSQTITGLYSNFKDAIDVALNGLGKANEGTIADAIKGATTLVENYDKVVDTLKVLVATYGAYKAATIAVAVAENYRATSTVTQMVSNGIKMVQVTKSLTAAQWLQVKSTAALNAIMAINPYVAAATALAGLITIVSVFGREAKTTEDFVSQLNDSIDQIGKQEDVDQLVAQYTELSGKANKTAEEQKALNETIQQLGTIFPDAIGKTDEHGRAIDLVTDKLHANNEALRENIRITTEAELDEAQSKLDQLIARRNQLLSDVNTGQRTTSFYMPSQPGAPGYIQEKTITLNARQIAESRTEINGLTKEIDQLSETVVESNRQLSSLSAADATQILAPYKELFNEASEYSRQQALDVKADLVALLGEGLGTRADSAIRKQIDALDSQLALPTIKQQIAETTTALSEAKAKLKVLRSDASQATSKEITEQEELIENLVKNLEVLTGVKQKKDKELKTLKDQIDKLYKDLQTADENDRQIIANRIILLEREKQLREEIANQAIKVARNDEIKPIQSRTSDITGVIKDADGRPLFIGKGQLDIPKKLELEYAKLEKRIIKTRENGTSGLLSDMGEMADAAAFLSDKYAEQLGLSEDQRQVLNDIFKLSSGVVDIASGNYVQGAVKILDSAISMFTKAPEKLSEHFENVQKQVDKLINSLNVAGESLAYLGNTGTSNQIKVLERNLRDVAEEARRLNESLGDGSYGPRRGSYGLSDYYGRMIRDAADLRKEIEELTSRLVEGNVSDDQRKAIEAVLNSYNALMGQVDAITQEITGTTVQSLAESLTEAFMAGEDAAEAWGAKVDEIIKNVIVRQLAADVVAAPVQAAISTLVKNTKDGLSPDEAENFKAAIQAIYTDAAPVIEDAIAAIKEAGIDLQGNFSNQGLTGAIKGITEETAGIIAGQLMGIRYDIKAIIAQIAAGQEDTVNNITYLKEIAENTRYNKHLETIDEKLSDMNSLLKNL